MKRTTVVILLVLMFALAAGAGAVTAKLSSRLPANQPTVDRSTLGDELHLSPAQRDQMQQIWQQVRGTSQRCLGEAQQIQHEQEKQLEALLNDEQKAKWSQITTQSAARVAALQAERDNAFKIAVEKTEKMLDDSQRRTYRDLIRDRVGFPTDGAGTRSTPGLN